MPQIVNTLTIIKCWDDIFKEVQTSLVHFQSGVSLNPVRVLKADADEEKAETARLSSFVGAMAVGDLVKSTLGPKGMDKILWGVGRNEGQVEVTNDGATILKAIGVDNPAAKVLVEMSKVQVGCQPCSLKSKHSLAVY